MTQQPSKLNSLSIGMSAAKLGLSAASGITKSAFSGINQGVNLANTISELRGKFNSNQQSEIIRGVPLIIDSYAKAILSKNKTPGLPPKTIMTNKLAAAVIEASKSTLNSALGVSSFGRQAFGEVSKHINVANMPNKIPMQNQQVSTVKKPRIGGKTYKRKHKGHKKSRKHV
jgi:hypothetical protein